MKKILILCAFAAFMLGACTVEKRVITARHWANDTIYYTAYFEWEETNFGLFVWMHDDWTKIKRCNLRDDNTMACVDEQEAQVILNPQHEGEVERTSGAPAEAAPAEAAPAESPAEAPAAEE